TNGFEIRFSRHLSPQVMDRRFHSRNKEIASKGFLSFYLFPKSKSEKTGIRHLFNHLYRPIEHLGRNRDADLSRGLEIERKVELRRLYQSQVPGLGAFENLVDVFSRAAREIG